MRLQICPPWKLAAAYRLNWLNIMNEVPKRSQKDIPFGQNHKGCNKFWVNNWLRSTQLDLKKHQKFTTFGFFDKGLRIHQNAGKKTALKKPTEDLIIVTSHPIFCTWANYSNCSDQLPDLSFQKGSGSSHLKVLGWLKSITPQQPGKGYMCLTYTYILYTCIYFLCIYVQIYIYSYIYIHMYI